MKSRAINTTRQAYYDDGTINAVKWYFNHDTDHALEAIHRLIAMQDFDMIDAIKELYKLEGRY